MKQTLKRKTPIILSTISIIGTISTTILGIKATPKALRIISFLEKKNNRALTKKEIVKATWKEYIPTFLSGVSTISCILGSIYLNNRMNASLITGYNIMYNRLNDYRMKLKEASTISKNDFESEILKSKMGDDMKIIKEKELFFDYASMQYFQSSFEELKIVETLLNQKIYNDGYATLNDLYDLLKIPHVPYGYQMGWSIDSNDDLYGNSGLEFQYDEVTFDDGLICTILTVSYPPSWEYFY